MTDNWDSTIASLGKQVKTSYSIEMDEIERRKLIQHLHHLEKSFIHLMPNCERVIGSIYELGLQFIENDDNRGLGKIASYPSCANRSQPDDNNIPDKKEHIQKTRQQLEDFIWAYKYVNSESDPKKQKALKVNLDYTFREINWSQQVRTIFSSKLSVALTNWDMLRKRLNRLLKQHSKTPRINRFEYLSFLDNLQSYPLEQEIKDLIIAQVKPEIDNINSVLGVSILDNFNVVSEIIMNFNNYIIGKKAVLLSIKRYIANVCRKANIRDSTATEEIINAATIEISSVLYRYRTEYPFIPYIHTWCHAAITRYKVNQKVLRAPMQIEQKRSAIWQAFNDVTKNSGNKEINFELVATRLKEIDPKSKLDAHTIQSYIRTEDVSGFSAGGTDEQCYSESIDAKNGLYGENDFSRSPEEITYKNAQEMRILKEIKRLDQVDQTIILLKLKHGGTNSTIADIADICNLSYDQCRRRIEKCNEILEKYID